MQQANAVRSVFVFAVLGALLAGAAWALLIGVADKKDLPKIDVETQIARVAKHDSANDRINESPTRTNADPVMDEAQREFLWEVEHHGNVLSEYGFKPWGRLLSVGDRQSLRRLLAEAFEGITPVELATGGVSNGRFQVEQWELGDSAGIQVTGDGFVDRLMQYREVFDDPPQFNLALMNLCPTNRADLDSDWRGGCQIRLWSGPSSQGPREVILKVEYSVARPDKSKYESGGWLRSCTIRQAQIAVAPKQLFREVAAERGIKRTFLADRWETDTTRHGHAPGGGVYICDYNRDGRCDLFITEQGNFRLYEGQAEGRFRNVTPKTKLIEQHGQQSITPVAFADLDGDGWEDLILGDSVYRNEQGRRFADMTARTYLRIPAAASGIAVADYDHDGRIDLYISIMGVGPTDSWLEGESGHETGNQLWRNAGDWRFVNVTQRAHAEGGRRSTFSSNWLDANNDGWSDLYVINEFGNGVMLWNQMDGTFREQLLADRPTDYGSMGVTSGDIDNDGDVDIYVAGMYSKAGNRVIGNVRPGTYSEEITAMLNSLTTGSQVHRNLGHGRFEQVGRELEVASVGWAYGPALVDLDNDGWLDIHALAGFRSITHSKPDG